jgi:hypothetical protein
LYKANPFATVKQEMKTILFIALIVFAGCQPKADKVSLSQPLFKTWTGSITDDQMDLSTLTTDDQVSTVQVTLGAGGSCSCSFRWNGSNSSGTYDNICGGACGSYNTSGDYTNTDGILTMCDSPNNCMTFH